MFEYNPDTAPYAINKKVACITDADPIKKEKEPEGTNRKSWKKCFPFELNVNLEKYEYKAFSAHVKNLKELSDPYENIDVFTPPEGEGKTLLQKALHDAEKFDARRSLFVDDNLAVLASAREFGLENLLAIARPVSHEPPREVEGFVAIEGVCDLMAT